MIEIRVSNHYKRKQQVSCLVYQVRKAHASVSKVTCRVENDFTVLGNTSNLEFYLGKIIYVQIFCLVVLIRLKNILHRKLYCVVNIWNSLLPNSIVDDCTVNAFKAHLDKFWQQQLVKFDFTADLTGTGNR